jgi:hypothetical protein
LIDAMNFRTGAGTKVPWTIHFTEINGAHYIREKDANGAMANGGLIFTSAAVSFEFTPDTGRHAYEYALRVPFLDEP